MAAANGFTVDATSMQSVVKMKGLPFKATPDDVIKFFQGFTLSPDRIYLKRHPDGRPNGEAFVVFDNADEARRATQKDRETFGDKFGDRYVRVYPTLDSDVSDMQAAVVQQNLAYQQGGGHAHAHLDSVVKMKSLPFDATQLDIIQFFDGFKLKPNGVQLVVRSDNKPTGEAFVDFEAPEEASRAIREKDHKVFSEKFGDRYVRLIQVSRKEMQATLALRFGGEGILKVKGIPFKASAADVRKFFSGFKIKPEGISFIMHPDGRPTGMAFIEFETPQEAVRAMEKDRAKFGPEYGDRFCMLQLVGRHEMEKVNLQRENEQGNKLLTMRVQNGLTALQAAFAAQAALSPAALQPMLMAGGNPWLQAGLPVGLMPGGHHGNGGQMLDASALAAAGQFGSQLGGGGPGALSMATQQLGALNLLQQQQQQNGNGGPMVSSASQQEMPPGWVAGVDPGTGLLFYQNPNGERAWATDPRRLAAAQVEPGWPEHAHHGNSNNHHVGHHYQLNGGPQHQAGMASNGREAGYAAI